MLLPCTPLHLMKGFIFYFREAGKTGNTKVVHWKFHLCHTILYSFPRSPLCFLWRIFKADTTKHKCILLLSPLKGKLPISTLPYPDLTITLNGNIFKNVMSHWKLIYPTKMSWFHTNHSNIYITTLYFPNLNT